VKRTKGGYRVTVKMRVAADGECYAALSFGEDGAVSLSVRIQSWATSRLLVGQCFKGYLLRDR
jgi:hypothetical protein